MFSLLAFILFQCVYAYEPSCLSCKWVIPHPRGNLDYNLCGFYKNKYNIKGKETIIYEFASYCRSNESMCGTGAYMYEELQLNDIIQKEKVESSLVTQLKDEYEELQHRCCGEVNETSEIEQLEREMFEIFQKIKKHNKKNIYKTTKDLYKLFKKNSNSNSN